MAFEGLNIEQITEAHISALIGVSEGRDLDFKQATYGNTDSDKREFLADISSFANTIGGHLVIGITEDAGVATGINPFTTDADAEILRLESIALQGVQPRIIGIRIAGVSLTVGGKVLIVHIPRSWIGPHRVTAQGSNRFYMRAGTRKYEPDVEELRQSFTAGPAFSQRLRDFQYDRISKIIGGSTPAPRPPADKTMLVMHILPYSAFLGPYNVEVSEIMRIRGRSFMPMQAAGANSRINLEGVVTYTINNDVCPAYTQIWKNGCIEAVRSPLVRERDGQKIVAFSSIVKSVLGGVDSYFEGLRALNFSGPAAIFVTIIGANGAVLYLTNNVFEEPDAFDRDMLIFSEVIASDFTVDVEELLDPLFDQIANAGGYEAAPA